MTPWKQAERLRGAVAAPAEVPGGGGGVPAEAVIWAFRYFAGRDPVDEAEIALHRQHPSIDSLRAAFLQIREFEPVYLKAKGGKKRFGALPFLLRPPADPATPWRFEPPTLEHPVSQLCTAAQFEEPAFQEIMEAMALRPSRHRRLWESVFVIAVLATEGLIAPGRRGLGFGVGRERVPAVLASRGVEVVATAAPDSAGPASAGGSHPAQFLDLFYPEIIHLDDFERMVRFEPLQPGVVPAGFAGAFDFCWSSHVMEGLGSLAAGLGFVERSLAVLRPGGIAIHMSELNLSSDEATIETPELSVLRRCDLEALAAHLGARGHEVLPLNLYPGHDAQDEVVDAPPFGLPHLKAQLGGLMVTSFGLVVRKGR
jgi:hypothetical protein